MRQEGFYWVNKDGEWTIAEYSIAMDMGYWRLAGYSSGCSDDFFQEIDENRIVRNQNKESPHY